MFESVFSILAAGDIGRVVLLGVLVVIGIIAVIFILIIAAFSDHEITFF